MVTFSKMDKLALGRLKSGTVRAGAGVVGAVALRTVTERPREEERAGEPRSRAVRVRLNCVPADRAEKVRSSPERRPEKGGGRTRGAEIA